MASTKVPEQSMLSASLTPQPGEPERLDMLDMLVLLSRRRQWILASTFAMLAAGIALALLLKPNYTATAIILPPEQRTSSSMLLGQLNPLATLGGSASSLGLKTPADMYIGILKSRTIADQIIRQNRLQEVYHRKTLADARKRLGQRSTFESGKDGLIHISVTDHDPQRASDIANGYVDALHAMNASLAITEASQRRVFFDAQLDEERKALAAAEEDLRQTQQKTGLIQLSAQAEMILRSIADLRAEIASREVEMQSLKTYATDQNPNVIRLSNEIAAMQAQLSKLESDQKQNAQFGGVASTAGNVPADSLEYTRKLREVKYHDALLDLLAKQAEAARIDEAKSAPVIQVVDRATAPDKRSGPPRTAIAIGFALLGLLLGCAAALMEHLLMRLRREPAQAAKLHDLRMQFRRIV